MFPQYPFWNSCKAACSTRGRCRVRPLFERMFTHRFLPCEVAITLKGRQTDHFPKLGGFHLLSGKVLIVCWTLSGMFRVRLLNRPSARKRTHRGHPKKDRESNEKSGTSHKRQDRTKLITQVEKMAVANYLMRS